MWQTSNVINQYAKINYEKYFLPNNDFSIV